MNPEKQLGQFISKFTPEIAELAVAALAKMRVRFPSAVQLVYDSYNALVIGFGPTERASDAIFSIAIFPKRVSLCLLQAGKSNIKDPHQLMQGSGSTNRFIPLGSAIALKSREIREIMSQALAEARVPLSPSGVGHLVVKSVSARQRSRKPM